LPKTLPNNDELKNRLSQFTAQNLEKFNLWYKLDTNALPDGEYHLTPLKDVGDSSYWDDALPNLLKALDGFVFEDDLRVGRSVTEYEVSLANVRSTHILMVLRLVSACAE
jgi:hypothetical protein